MDEKAINSWWKRLSRCLNDMPEGIELLVEGDTVVSIYPKGALYERHLGSKFDNHGISEENHLHTGFFKRVYPYGEGI